MGRHPMYGLLAKPPPVCHLRPETLQFENLLVLVQKWAQRHTSRSGASVVPIKR